jgi:hypothetical protein
MTNIKRNMNAAQDRKKIYAEKGRTRREFRVGDHVFSKVKDKKSSQKLGSCSKLEKISSSMELDCFHFQKSKYLNQCSMG